MNNETKVEALKGCISMALSHLRNIGGMIDVNDAESQSLLTEVSKCHDDLKQMALEVINA